MLRTAGPPDGQGRLARHRLAQGVRRPGRAGLRPVHLLQRGPAGPGAVPLRHPQHRGPHDHAVRHRRAEELLPLGHPGRRDQTARSATPSPEPAPTWPRSGPGPCSTATSGSSTGTRSSPAAPTRPTSSGWPPAPTPTPPSTRGSPSSWCRPPTPGFSCTPIVTVGGVATTASYYDNVRVPRSALVGELNEGWRLITGQLNHERVGLAAVSALATRLWDETAQWVVDEGVADVDWVQADLARTYALLEAQKLLNWRMTAAVADDTLGPADSSAVKVFGTETTVEIYRRLLGIVGLGRVPQPRQPGSGAPRRPRAGRPPVADQHLRRRGQRGPARDPGHGRSGDEAVVPVSAAEADDARAPSLDERLQAFVGAGLVGAPGQQPAPRSGQPADDPPLGGGHGGPQPGLRGRGGGPGGRLRGDHRPADHAAGLDHAGPAGDAWPGRGTGRGARPRATRPATADGPAGRGRIHLGGGHQLRPALRAAAGARRPARGHLGDRFGQSAEKATGLGVGHFVTTRLEFTDQNGESGGHHAVPDPQVQAPAEKAPEADSPRPKRPRPALTQDNRFFFEGAKQHKLLIQRCSRVRDPPPPAPAGLRQLPVVRVGHGSPRRAGAPSTASWSTTTPRCRRSTTRWWWRWSSSRRAPAWWPTWPASPRRTVAIGMPVVAAFEAFDEDLTLPVFRPASAGRRCTTELDDETTATRRLKTRRGALMDFTFDEEQTAVRGGRGGDLLRTA